MPVVPTIDVSKLREFNRKLQQIDPELRKQVGKDIKSAMQPQISAMKSRIPQQPPLSGMAGHGGRTAWRGVNVSGRAAPGGGRGAIALIEVFGRGQGRAIVKMADLAGTRGSYIRGERGRKFVQNLERRYPLSASGRGGRFGWANFIRTRGVLIDNVVKVLNKYSDKVSRSGL